MTFDVTGLATDATYAYFAANGGVSAMRRVPLAGGCADVLAKPTKTGELVSDATTLCFFDAAASTAIESLAKP